MGRYEGKNLEPCGLLPRASRDIRDLGAERSRLGDMLQWHNDRRWTALVRLQRSEQPRHYAQEDL